MLEIYRKVNERLNSLDFSHLFDGFHKYRFALYNDLEACLDGTTIPRPDSFMGNTAIRYKNEHIAIWNMDTTPDIDLDILASSVVHEMFHCHQMTLGEDRFPDDFALLALPETTDYYLQKHSENCHLARAYEDADMEALQAFATLRAQRMRKYPAAVREECKAETVEGFAVYIERKALRGLAQDKFDAAVRKDIGHLRAKDDLLFDARRLSYFSGAIYLLCLYRLGIAIQNSFGSQKTVYEQNLPDIGEMAVSIRPDGEIAQSYNELLCQRQQKVSAHIAGSAYVPCDALIYGYDPMNMFRFENIVYCSHFVMLRTCSDDSIKSIFSPVALRLADGENRKIVGYYTSE